MGVRRKFFNQSKNEFSSFDNRLVSNLTIRNRPRVIRR